MSNTAGSWEKILNCLILRLSQLDKYDNLVSELYVIYLVVILVKNDDNLKQLEANFR